MAYQYRRVIQIEFWKLTSQWDMSFGINNNIGNGNRLIKELKDIRIEIIQICYGSTAANQTPYPTWIN